MKSRMRHVQPRESIPPGNERVRVEIASYLLAVASYPERFAENPKMSFEQYLGGLVAATETLSRRRQLTFFFD
jgi:hypothetical protein